MTKAEALRAIKSHGVTIKDILEVMPKEKDKSHPHAEDAEILKRARGSGSSLSDVLRNASEIGGSGFEGDLIDWIEDWVKGNSKMKPKAKLHDLSRYDPHRADSDEDSPTGEAYRNMIDLGDEEFDGLVIPAGIYPVRIKLIPNDDGDELWTSASGFTCYLDGKYKGRSFRHWVNVELTNAKPPNLANYEEAIRRGKAFLRAVLQKRWIEDWDEINNKVCWVRVGIQPASGGYPERNVILGVVQRGDADRDDE
jgi:hypothetical protein